MIVTRTPFRISFFGGGTDFPLWYRDHGGAVLATTIDKFCYINMRRLPPFFEHKHRIVYSHIENVQNIADIQHPAVRAVFDWANVTEGLEVHHDGDLPARSGLGSSSSFTVGLMHALAALSGQMITKEQLARDSIHVEQNLIKENVGSQDQISAAFGGFNRIKFHKNGSFAVDPVITSQDRLEQLQNHLMLCFTGFTRLASEIEGSKMKRLELRETELRAMHAMVDPAVELLQDPSLPIEEFGKMLHQTWGYKQTLSEKVSTPEIDAIYNSAITAGALGGKILGAGGGGFLLLFARPEDHACIKEKLNQLVHVPFNFENAGSRVVLYQPDGL